MNLQEENERASRAQPQGGLESPFLAGEFFERELEEEWEPRAAALAGESPFLRAFESGAIEPEAGEESYGWEHESKFLDEVASLTEEELGIVGGKRVRVRDTLVVPFQWICRIWVQRRVKTPGHEEKRGLAPAGTGLLISPRHVLTAAHVLHGVDERGSVVEEHEALHVEVAPAADGDLTPFGRIEAISWNLPPEWKPATHLAQFDYAVITLKEAVGERTLKKWKGKSLCFWGSPTCGVNTSLNTMPSALAKKLIGARVLTGGFPAAKKGEMWCAAGKLSAGSATDAHLTKQGIVEDWAKRAGTFFLTTDASEGQSGSPVWIVDNGNRYLVGVLVSIGEKYNTALNLREEVVRQIQSWTGQTAASEKTEKLFEEPGWFEERFDDIGESGAEVFESPSAFTIVGQSLGESEEYAQAAVRRSPLRIPEGTEWSGGAEEPGTFGEVEDEFAEDSLELLAEQPTEERFDPSAVPQDVADALAKPDWPLALKLAIQAGSRNENDLTNLIFFAKHKELRPEKKLDPKGPLSDEWTKIRNDVVWKAIQVSAENSDLVVSGEEVTDHHRRFFRGKSGKRLKKLVEDAAREVDLNPGLLGTIMMAETRCPQCYLGRGKVSSYDIGTDDFYEGRAAIKARVSTYYKVKWDESQKPAEHLNDAKQNPRMVKTILFDSGSDAVLATAVYVKFREVRFREIATELKGDFDNLPLATRFALTRMAMAAGTAGATPFLKDALKGVDIFIRKAIPVQAYQTQRNATVRTAQAMHLSDWIFGIPMERATRPVSHELEAWNEEQEDLYDLDSGLEGESGEDAGDIEIDVAWPEDEMEQDANPIIIQHDVPSRSTRLVVIGQRIEIDLTKTAFGTNLEQVRWTIPGRVVRGYEGTVSDAKLFELTSADLERPKISFFWVDAANGRTVRAKIRLKSGTDEEFVAVFDVEGSKMNYFTGEPGVTRLERAHGTLGMRFGKLFEAPGIKWKWKITMPPHHAGFIKDVQTVLVDRTRIQYLEPGKNETRILVRRHPSKKKPHIQLDGDSNNEPIYTPGLTSEKTEAGQSYDTGRGISDSPYSDLASLDKTVSVNDQFTYYIMFKPVTDKPQDAIWVPVAKAKWLWKTTAEQREKKWGLGKSPKMEPSIKMMTVDFPLYQSNADENKWQQISPATSEEQSAGQDNDFVGELEQIEESEERADHLYKSEEYGGQSQEENLARDEEIPPYPESFQTPWAWHEDVSLRHAFQKAIRTVSDDAHKIAYNVNGALPDVSTIPIVIVALVGPGGRPSFAGQNMNRMYYSGSLLKVAAMYGAFQLRKVVADFANTLPSGLGQSEVFKAFKRAFDAKILASAPTLPDGTRGVPKYADVLKVTPDGIHYKVEFLNAGDHSRRDFDFHLKQMVELSHNPSAGVCIQSLGYSWINGVLRAAGLFSEDTKKPRNSLDRFSGIWLAGDYLYGKPKINKEHQLFLKNKAEERRGVEEAHRTKYDKDAEEEFQMGISGLVQVRVPSVNDGPSKQATSCLDMANLMAQVANDSLIAGDTAANTQIGNMLRNAVRMSIIGKYASSTHFEVLQSKVGWGQLSNTGSCNADASGHTNGCTLSEALVIQKTAAPKRKYVVVYQDIQDPWNHDAKDLERVRDIIEFTIDKF